MDLAVDERFPLAARLPAAHYLVRSPARMDSLQTAAVINRLPRETNADLRMAFATGLGKSGRPEALSALQRLQRSESDWRVRTSILRAFANFDYGAVRDDALEALRDPNPLVAQTAAEYFVNQGIDQDATLYWRLGRDSLPARVRSTLYRAANTHLANYYIEYRESINYQLRQRYGQTADPYEQADILTALGAFPWNYRLIRNLASGSTAAPVQTAAVRAMGDISRSDRFGPTLRSSAGRVRREIAYFLQQDIQSGDAGRVYEAATVLSDQAATYRPLYDSLAWAETALAKLELPAQTESYDALRTAIALLRGEEAPVAERPAFNRPIDWSRLETAGERPRLTITTNRGALTVELWPDLAPGTVSSFLKLVDEKFYADKLFHRVVPNFVVQGGDPRGDGYGSLPFSLRTETPPVHYDRGGILGVASAGPDTEGVQFFITHSPTPHLDGRYTAFGRVLEGMDVVGQLLIGDRIQSIKPL